MFLPIGDAPNPPRFTPYVNYGLIALNILVYFALLWPLADQGVDPRSPEYREYERALGAAPRTAFSLFIFEHGFKPAAWSLRDLFSSMFLHGGFGHLAGNMLFLWIYGDNVEHRLGRFTYLAAYLVTGVLATVTFAAFAPDSMVPMVGASGAISGVLGLYFVLFPKNEVKVLVFLPFLLQILVIPARVVLGFYLVFDNLVPVLLAAETNVAYGAHIGGFVGGLGLAWLGRRLPLPDSSRPRSGTKARNDPHSDLRDVSRGPSLDDVIDAIEQRDTDRVVALTERLGPRPMARLSLAQQLEVADHLDAAGQAAAATHILRQAKANHQTDRDALARISLALGLLRLRAGRTSTAYQHLLDAIDLSPNSPAGRHAQEALAQIPLHLRPNA